MRCTETIYEFVSVNMKFNLVEVVVQCWISEHVLRIFRCAAVRTRVSLQDRIRVVSIFRVRQSKLLDYECFHFPFYKNLSRWKTRRFFFSQPRRKMSMPFRTRYCYRLLIQSLYTKYSITKLSTVVYRRPHQPLASVTCLYVQYVLHTVRYITYLTPRYIRGHTYDDAISMCISFSYICHSA